MDMSFCPKPGELGDPVAETGCSRRVRAMCVTRVDPARSPAHYLLLNAVMIVTAAPPLLTRPNKRRGVEQQLFVQF